MTKRMLIDATHAEETRVVVLDGNRLEDFDVETSTKKQLKGNIYLAKVIRVEPSLQAAFIEYGGNRHGFLAFGEIHPDYYQIPVADRQRLLEMQAGEARREEEREDEAGSDATAEAATPATAGDEAPAADDVPAPDGAVATAEGSPAGAEAGDGAGEEAAASGEEAAGDGENGPEVTDNLPPSDVGVPATLSAGVETIASDAPPPETLGGEDAEESPEPRPAPRYMRQYKIQEVIRRRQILLVQVVKEERGNKGAALTTYISLAGRYCVLMPNSPHGGGISRKITSAADRKRLREVIDELALSDGMGLIVRTAGAGRPKPEIKRDCEYLLRLWDSIRETTLNSTAPALIHEEANLIRRAIRDVYARDVEEILVDGEDAYRAAKDYMRMLMPSHARKVQAYKDGGVPLFAKAGVEHQLDAMHSSTVQLRSGGYLVINQTEALVAIDVNSGRATRERGIEETALRTNMEAAEELGRQLRLRDLAGLIVVDFIDMEARKHNAQVERKLKDALKNDRARIQVGHISHFGLLEMSRQRLRPSLVESSFIPCPHCNGTGLVRSIESSAVHVLRAIEEEGAKHRASEIRVHVAGQVALYILNHKRDRLGAIEERCGMRVLFDPDPALVPPQVKIDRVKAATAAPAADAVASTAQEVEPQAEDEAEVAGEDEETVASAPARQPRRRRDSGARRTPETGTPPVAAEAGSENEAAADDAARADATDDDAAAAGNGAEGENDADAEHGEQPRRRRRGRRGGRRRRREGEAGAPADADESAREHPDESGAPAWSGPTPADPYGGVDIFDVMEAAERGGGEHDAGAALPEVQAGATDHRPDPEEAPSPVPPLLPIAEGLETPVIAPPSAADAAALPDETVPAAATAAPPVADPAPALDTAAGEAPFPPVLPVVAPHPFEAGPGAPSTLAAPAEDEGARTEAAAPAPAPSTADEPPPEAHPAPSPVVQPVLVDGGDESVPKRRGWWRR